VIFFLRMLLVSFCFIQGCAVIANTSGRGGDWVYVELSNDSVLSPAPEVDVYETNYKIGEEHSVFIGQEIFKVTSYNKQRSMYQEAVSQKDISIEAIYGADTYRLKITKNDNYPTSGIVDIKGKSYHLIQLFDTYNRPWGILIDDSGGILKNGIYSYEHKMIYYPSSIEIMPDNIKFSLQKKIVDTNVTPGSSFDLIYSGKNNVSINATYREYSSDNLTKPSFFQNLTYQASAKQIRFKKFVIQIHGVSNEKITYTIVADGLEGKEKLENGR
jgi:hypothetical protein